MQIELQVFLALLVGYLVADYPLQSVRTVGEKAALLGSAYFRHGIVHLVLSIIALALFTPALVWQLPTVYALALLTAGHLASDWGKNAIVRARPDLDGSVLFVLDLIVHLAIISAAAMIIVREAPGIGTIRTLWLAQQDKVLIVSTVLLIVVFPVGYLIRFLLAPLSDELVTSDDDAQPAIESVDGLRNAGMYIGWLERALLVIAFAVGSIAAVGLILGAKSVVRFPKFESRAFAEYFLIGTFMSVAFAALGGWILRTALQQLVTS